MISLRTPSASVIREFIAAQAKLELTYSWTGAAGSAPPGYALDHARTRLGDGEKVFLAAKTAIRRWEQFRLGWAEACPPDTPIESGQVVAVLARSMGVWLLNACRIVAVVDEPARFGFTYATLPDHVETGEERFLVEWDKETSSVWYDIVAISRPRHVLAWLGYPMTRRAQRKFRADSAAAMTKATQT